MIIVRGHVSHSKFQKFKTLLANFGPAVGWGSSFHALSMVRIMSASSGSYEKTEDRE